MSHAAPAHVAAEPAGDVTVDVMVESPLWQALPAAERIVRGAIARAAEQDTVSRGGEVAVLLCDDAAIANLNAQWRGISKPTNVLSFPASPHHAAPGEAAALGDIAIAYETVASEAAAQGKTVADHLAHLAVHGFLHLLGYDHHEDAQAERMERLERDILARIGIADPYASRDAD
jgi:probable rRNA maturation factor